MSILIADMLKGVDVSKYQGDVDWKRVAGTGVRFAFARAVDDKPPGDKADPTFAANFAGIKAAGILRGAYHFFRPRRDAVAQAKLFVSIIGELKPGDLPPVLDLEDDGSSRLHQLPPASAKMIVEGMTKWIDIVESALNRRVVIYTNAEYWLNKTNNSTRFRDHLLWIAHYNVDIPIVPTAFRSFSIHQYDVDRTVPGIPRTGSLVKVPQDRFNGSINELRELAELPPIEGVGAVTHMQPRFAVAKKNTPTTHPSPARKAGRGGKSVPADATQQSTKKTSATGGDSKKAVVPGKAQKRQSPRKSSSKKRAKDEL